MQTDLQKRILSNVLLDPHPEHILLPRRTGLSMGIIVSLCLFAVTATALVLMLLSRLKIMPH